MKVDAFLREVRNSRDYEGQMAHVQDIPAREATFGDPEHPLTPRIAEALGALGIQQLYTHQAAAVDAIRRNENTVIVTSTASGKTLCYSIPVLESLAVDPETRALWMFPTKALAQDQLKTLRRFLECAPDLPVVSGTYDGDTPQTERRTLRDRGRVILTNPDMLHSGILANHSRWAGFFENLKYVVIDEVHTYRGVFGSHVANVMRRLRRVCAHYGAHPVSVLCSATIANPKELAEAIVGEAVTLVGNDGSPRGRKRFVLWNPPHLDESKLERRSPHTEAERLLVSLIRGGSQTICFVRARVLAETIYRYAQDSLRRHAPRLANAIRAYRGGYIAEQRREIERQLFSGELMGVVSTVALELGIDIGSLDACLTVGYPGSIASLWQQAGRAGRGTEDSLAMLIGYNSPIDQFLMQNPSYLFSQSPEMAVVDPTNPHIVAWHLRCACHELPVSAADEGIFGEYLYSVLDILTESGDIRRRGNRWYWAGQGYPATQFSLRNIPEDVYQIIDQTDGRSETIGETDETSAFFSLYTQAIYMHNAETYFVKELNIDRKHAYIEKVDCDYYTQSVDKREIRVVNADEERKWRISQAFFGDVTVTEMVVMFRKIQFGARDSIGFGSVDLPPIETDTEALWVVPPREALDRIRQFGRVPQDGLLGVGNVIVGVMPLFVMSDPMDVGAAVDSSNVGSPSLFIYDKHAGGVGFAQRAFGRIEEIMEAALSLIHGCDCSDGCPSCVGAPLPPYAYGDVDSSSRGTIPDKEAALCLLHSLLEREPYTPKPVQSPLGEAVAPLPKGPEPTPHAPPAPPPPPDYARLPEEVERKLVRRLATMKRQRPRRVDRP